MVMGGGEGNVYKTHKCNLDQVQYLLEFGVSSMLICFLTPWEGRHCFGTCIAHRYSSEGS